MSGLTDKWNTQSRRFVEGAMKIGLLVFCFLFLPTQEVIAQERLSPNQNVARKIEPGKTDLFAIALNDGDYFQVSIATCALGWWRPFLSLSGVHGCRPRSYFSACC